MTGSELEPHKNVTIYISISNTPTRELEKAKAT